LRLQAYLGGGRSFVPPTASTRCRPLFLLCNSSDSSYACFRLTGSTLLG
jgi:hypothetical protein